MKKLLALVLTTIMLTGVMSGCKPATTAEVATATTAEVATATTAEVATATTAEVATSTAVQEPNELVIWCQNDFQEAFLKTAKEAFLKNNPDVKITIDFKAADQYYALLNTAFQSDSAPDIFWTHGTKTSVLPKLVQENYVMDLTDKIDVSQYDKEAPYTTSVIRVNNKIYLTPMLVTDTRAMYYNKDIFEKNGISVPKTYDEFIAVCDKLLKNGVTPMSLGGGFSWSVLFHFEPMLVALAPDWVNEAVAGKAKMNDPRVTAVLNEMKNWGDKGYFGKDYTSVDEAGQILAFSTGKVAMTCNGSWQVGTIMQNNPDLNFGAFRIPSKDGKQPMVVTPSSGFSIKANTKSPTAAVKFIQLLNSLEGQQMFVTASGAVPAIPELIASNPVVQEVGAGDSFYESFYNIIGWWAKDGENPRTLWEEDSTKVLSGDLDAQKFLDSIENMQDYSQAPKK